MGSKVKCPSCGAKNDATSRRCRMCTTIINADAPEPSQAAAAAPPPPDASAPLADHFDAGVIDRQLQPARSKFGGGTDALASRLAAAREQKARAAGVAPASSPPPAVPGSPAPPVSDPFASSSSPTPAPPSATDGQVLFEPLAADELGTRPPPPTAPPIEYEAEPFDPGALFRDGD